MAILKTALCAAAIASPLAAPVVDWVVEQTSPVTQAVAVAQIYIPPPIDMGKLGDAFRR
ncbi:hypothetical protein GJ699_06805 [Duganella sp. FT80W]|uniref:Uncharacterized protein n=1 Tax=Duganella guangzhouensis TaxID=2666084 RepID=A0A6I2KXF8_9BURK|nr:hypothetical protein [Duganella guangzhouensis]MRW89687.1 hypothetical protein [Duganella guangzhouensis]